MPKVLCLIGLVFSILVALIFLTDIVLGLLGYASAPLRLNSLAMDIIFLIAAGGIAYVSWTTFKEQK